MRYYAIAAIIALAAAKAKIQANANSGDPNRRKSKPKTQRGTANMGTGQQSSEMGYAGSPTLFHQ
jgi:hypothetical protein